MTRPMFSAGRVAVIVVLAFLTAWFLGLGANVTPTTPQQRQWHAACDAHRVPAAPGACQ